jgi:hypothetical protein
MESELDAEQLSWDGNERSWAEVELWDSQIKAEKEVKAAAAAMSSARKEEEDRRRKEQREEREAKRREEGQEAAERAVIANRSQESSTDK